MSKWTVCWVCGSRIYGEFNDPEHSEEFNKFRAVINHIEEVHQIRTPDGQIIGWMDHNWLEPDRCGCLECHEKGMKRKESGKQ